MVFDSDQSEGGQVLKLLKILNIHPSAAALKKNYL
jgi:hypothetical protein